MKKSIKSSKEKQKKPSPAPKKSMSDGIAISELLVLNDKQALVKLSKAQKSTLALRQHHWPDVTDSALWLRKKHDGYTTIPRTFPIFMELINDASKQVAHGKSVPAGKTLLVLWCRVFDEALVKIESEASAASEAGYSGERNISTWREHLRVLKSLEFIDYREGPAGPMQYILLFNPYLAAQKLRGKKWVQDMTWNSLFHRSLDIGATDLQEPKKE